LRGRDTAGGAAKLVDRIFTRPSRGFDRQVFANPNAFAQAGNIGRACSPSDPTLTRKKLLLGETFAVTSPPTR